MDRLINYCSYSDKIKITGGNVEFIKDYNKIAIIYDGKEITYKEIIRNSKIYAMIANLTLQEKAIIYMENRPEFLYSFLGIWERRGTCVCVDATLTGEELKYFIDDSEARVIFTSKANLKNVEIALEGKNNKDIKVLVVDEIDCKNYDLKENNGVIYAPEKDDIALMLYTSGTTGSPKGVMLKFDNILVNIEGLNKYQMFTKNDVQLALLPMHHIFPLLGSLVIPISKGSTIVFLRELSSNAMIEAFQKYKITIMIGVPRLWEMLHKKIMEKINAGKISKAIFKLTKKIKSISIRKRIFKKVHEKFGGELRFFVSGGSKLDKQIADDFLTLGIQICEGYGMTETAPMISFTPVGKIVPGSAGKILPNIEVKISDDGEILVRGRNVMAGYYKRPEATLETIDKDGWLSTGDLGEIKDEYLYITGRKKEMIVLSNGKNINPIEIEQWIISKTSYIQEIAIIERNSILTAVIVPNFQKIIEDKISNIKETLKWGIIDKYNAKAPNYKKILDIIIIQDELPKTKLGKIKRFLLPSLLDKDVKLDVEITEPDFEEYVELKKYLEKLKSKKIVSSAHLELDLGLDSLDMVELSTFLEAKFGIKLDEKIIVNNSTVSKLAEYIKENKSSIKYEEINWEEYLNKEIELDLPKSNIMIHIIKFILWFPFKLYVRVRREGIENIPKKTPLIFIGNHQSVLDSFIFGHVMPYNYLKNTYTLAKIKHFNHGYMRFMADHSNVILVDINKNLGEMLQTAAGILKQGKNLLIFPEGARSRDGKLLEFKKSFAILAKEMGAEIVPFAIDGAFEALPPNKSLPKFSKVNIKFFPAISPIGKSYEQIVDESKKTIQKWLDNSDE